MATSMFRTLMSNRLVIQRLLDHAWTTNLGRRTLLSEAYYGNEVWQKRKRLAMDMVELQLKLDRDFVDLNKPVPSIELHIFVDNIMTTAHLQTAEQYLYCHRHSSVAMHLRKPTIHAWFRACLRLNEPERALKTLVDKTNYGLFPDMMMFNILLDTFLKTEDYANAAAVGMEMMHTEVVDESTPLSQLLVLYACLKHISSGIEIKDEQLPNLGMTLADATRGRTSLLARSYHVIGYSMVPERLDQGVKALQRIAELAEVDCILQEAVSKLESAIENSDNNKLQDPLEEAVKKLKENNSLVDRSVDDLIQELVEKLPSIETNDIEQYPMTLLDWHKSNVHAVQRQREAKEAYIRSLKEERLEKLLQATGGVKYWLNKRKEEAKGIEEEKSDTFDDVEFIDKDELAEEVKKQ